MGRDNTLKYILCLNQNETEKDGWFLLANAPLLQ